MHLIFGIHCHQPLGNFGWVIEEACDVAYAPFIKALQRHPEARINLHYSGSLLEWAEEHRPDLVERLVGLGDQVEWMSGGFYEPPFPIIPHHDRVEQVERLTSYVEGRFGQRPRGMWLTERLWDPTLPESFAEAGMEYLPLDDFHFLAAGYPGEMLTGYFVADYFGSTVSVFPISQQLRYLMPFEEPRASIAVLRRAHERDPDSLLVMADDGEKFGLWPGTRDLVHGEGRWLDRFFEAVEAESDWLRLTTFERYMAAHPPKGRVAIPPGSYMEMTEWALPAETAYRLRQETERPAESGRWEPGRPFLGGGYWPNFQVKYPESNALVRKMLRLSLQLQASAAAPDEARTELLRGQSNCPYWHGVFGGLYLPHLRAEVHRRLISSRVLDDQATRGRDGWTEVEVLDWDGDAESEVHVELPGQSWVLDPADGGSLHYFDDKPSRWSVGDVIARRFEAYHPALQEEPGEIGEHASIHDRPATGGMPPVEEFFYDPHPRRWLIDHLLDATVSSDDFLKIEYSELAPLPRLRHRVESASGSGGAATVVLSGTLPDGGTLSKEVAGTEGRLGTAYRLSDLPAGRFGPEIPVSVWEGAARVRGGKGDWLEPAGPLALSGRRFSLRHLGRGTRVDISLSVPGELFAVPLRTISKSEAGYDEILQGLILWPHWRTEGDGEYGLEVEVGEDR
ncbi:MAG: alpha-amylase/4-alpha-glucanotransferase domain-containing protein [Acidimicrobiia bacterium]